MKKIYIVKYSSGSHDDFFVKEIFVTFNEELAKKYVDKFNFLFGKWKSYFYEFEDHEEEWLKDEYINTMFERWYKIRNINKCWFESIELRS
jgi:radical SAM superfamily enzyme YgiQ (UPF0313 family)